jgi:2-polyprenyl-6-methoxyphenol hydroxylase-like FAD-dependent oxidoreductase
MDEGAMTNTVETTCCIVGGGPAGMMLGFLLARAGVDTVVMEKHADFFRDFRGDTIHPSTLELMHELKILTEFLKLPHQKVKTLRAVVGGETIAVGDFSHLPVHCPYIALMPQWDFLNFLAEQAKRFPAFHLMMKTEGTDLIEENGAIAGVRAKTPEGDVTVRARLVVACDGRHSVMRERAGFAVDNLGAPMDVLWFRLRREDTDPEESFGYFNAGVILVTINRGDYWQCAYIIPKGSLEKLQAQGIEHFRAAVAAVQPLYGDRVGEITDWNAVKPLEVRVDRLKRWHRPGLLLIGDAAHAMSPIGGVGVNLAVQDAVAAANALAGHLRAGTLTEDTLRAVQRRREFPTAFTQRLQIMVQNRIVRTVLGSSEQLKLPAALALFNRFPFLRRLPARVVGLGVRPEHVKTPAIE